MPERGIGVIWAQRKESSSVLVLERPSLCENSNNLYQRRSEELPLPDTSQ